MRLFREKWTILIILFVIALLPRALDLGVFLTADEKNWIGRSFEFIRAFKDYRFNDMLQTTHPGATTMWGVGLSVTAWMLMKHIPFSFQNLEHFVWPAQFSVAFVNALAVPVIYLFLKKLVRRELALVATLFIALNPFFIGYSRVAHVDALLASFLFLAVLAIWIYAKENFSRTWLIASAVLSALAIMTKAPAVFLIPWFGLMVVLYKPAGSLVRTSLPRVKDFVLWALIIALLATVLQPALFFVPDMQGNALLFKRDVGEAAITPHGSEDAYSLSAMHYPATLLTRVTPLTQLFVFVSILVLISLLRNSSGRLGHLLFAGEAKSMFIFLCYVVFFVVMMTLGAKKGDRYILPAFLGLDVLAAFGLVYIARGLKYQKTIIVGVIVLMLVTVVRYHPYAIAYSNPFFPDDLSQSIGWGEGLDQVALWLNENDPDAVVASWYPEELGAFTSAQVAHINAHEQSKVKYVVLYRNMFGREPEHYANDFIDEYFTKRDPVYVATILGKEFAWVYEKRVFVDIVGELTPERSVSQNIEVARDGAAGVELLIATYSGRARSGDLLVGFGEQSWRVPIATIENDKWLKLEFSDDVSLSPGSYNLVVQAIGTTEKDAPALRFSKDIDYYPGEIVIDGEQKIGDVAVRVLYQRGGQLVNDEQTRLLD